MIKQSAGSSIDVCLAVPSIASINSRDGQCSSLIETSQRGGAWARGVARFRAALMIEPRGARLMTPAALVALTLIAGSVATRAQSCSGSPSYSPDFSSNQGCLQLNSGPNGGASFEPGASSTTLLQLTHAATNQVGSAWYITPQPVANSFSTTFTFQLTGGSADGFAFVVQNSSTGKSYVGDDMAGCALGYAGDPLNVCGSTSSGVTHSVAVGFKTYNDGTNYPSANSVFIASNGTGENCENVAPANDVCVTAQNDLTSPSITLADGNVHTVTVTYTTQPSALQTNCPDSAGCLDVILDGTDLFPHGVSFSMTSIGLTNNNSAYVGFTGATGASIENNDILSWVFSPQSFGEINVCTPLATTPAPCSNTLPVTLSPSTGTINTIQVVTQGTTPQVMPGLDFQVANGGTCATGAQISAPNTCTVNVTFAPIAPGLRLGAVQLLGNSGTPLATTQIYGVGEGPAVAFSPGTQSTVNTTPAYPLNVPNGVAVDAAGDVFISDSGNERVVKVAANGAVSTIGAGVLQYPQGLALDGAGDLFIADNNLNEVVEFPPNCTTSGCQSVVPTPQCVVGESGFCAQLGVAVDGAGNIFVASFNGEVLEVPANGGAQTVVYNPSGASPVGLAVDTAGDLFIADYGRATVVEIPAGCTNSGCWNSVGTGWEYPEAVAVDAAGDVFVADEAPKVVEVPAGCVNNLACQITISGTYAYGVAVDGKGNVYIPDRSGSAPYLNADSTNNQVMVVNRSQPPSLSFANTYVDTNTDSTQTVSVENIGNTALDFTSIANPTDFPEASGVNTDCPTASSVLNAGSICTLSIDFMPTTGGLPPNGTILNETVSLTDNALNVSGATQSVSVQGAGVESQVPVPNEVGQPEMTAEGDIAAHGLSLGSVTMASSITVPSGDVISQTPAPPAIVPVETPVSLVISTGLPLETVPNVVGQPQTTASTNITNAGLVVTTPVTTQYSDTVAAGNVISQSPSTGQLVYGSAVSLVVSNGAPPASDLLTLENNYFVTGDYATGGVALRGTSGTGTISIPRASCSAGVCGSGVPDGADIVDGFLFWTTLETTATPSGMNGTFLGYSITGQQVGSDVDNYNDGTSTGTLRVYRANVNTFFQVPPTWNGARLGSGTFTVQLPESTGTTTEGASLVVIYRVLSPLFPLKSVVIYDGSVAPTAVTGPIPQAMLGFYDAAGVANGTGMGELTTMYAGGGTWNNSSSSAPITESNQYIGTLNAGNAYAAVILSTPVNNSDGDGILDAWKASQGYTDVNTGTWVPLPGATQGEKDLFVQFDYMCGLESDGITCDPNQPNMYPAPDAQGNNPLTMVTQAFANSGVHLHLVTGNPVPLSVFTCTDGSVLCEFPSTADAPQPGVIAWNWGLELAKIWPINYNACTMSPSVANCAPHFAYGQKDSYHYVLFAYSLAVPAWNSWFGSLTSIRVTGGPSSVTTLVTTGLNGSCPTRITISGVQEDPNLNGVYNTSGCDSGLTTITVSTPNVPAWTWTYPNSPMAEPTIGVTSGTVTSISGYSDVGGSDSVVSLGLWEQNTNQDMSKAATVVAGTLFHELGHTLGLTHGGRYYDTSGTYIPTYEANCKPNFQSTMNYLFQLDGVGPASAITYSNQVLESETQGGTTPTALGGDSTATTPPFPILTLPSVYQLTDTSGNPATYSTSSWYTPTAPSSTASAATTHCDGTPLNGDTGYRVTGSVDPVSPAWASGQNITFDGEQYSDLRGFDDLTALDLRQIGATSSEFSTLASSTSYSSAGVTIGGGGGVTIGGGGGVTIGGGGGVTIGGGGGVTIGGGGGVTIGGGGGVTIGGGGGVTIGGGGGATTEVDYLTANSIVRPPNSPTITPVLTNGVETSVIVDWVAPTFGVVQNYTVYRSTNADGSDPVEIGVVNGVGGNPPATEFIDSNPVLGSTVVYTISTMLLPVPIDMSQRSSPPSVPAIMKNVQTIVLGPLASSFALSNTPPTVITVTATAEGNGAPSGLQVNFVATGPCSVTSQTVTPVSGTSGGISSASVTLLNQGSCTITATQPGTSPSASSGPPYYDAATPVSESFTILPASSTTQGQTIVWSPSQLPNVQYGNQFSVSAIAESNNSPDGQPVSFSATGPCTVGTTNGTATGTTTGVGRCTITASAPALTGMYTAATVSLSFTITPAVLTVTATSPPAIMYEQQIPTLTYTISGYVGNDATANPPVVSGTPLLSSTATTASAPGSYPITASTGTLAAANYSFLYVPGTLTIQPATPTISIMNLPTSGVYPGGFTATYSYSGNGTPMESVTSVTPAVCTASGSVVSYAGVGTCTLKANATATTDYSMATGSAQSFTVDQAPTISSLNTTTFVVGTAGTFTVTARGYPASMTYSKTGALPNGVTLSTAGVLSGTPAAGTGGSYPITITASNGITPAGTQSFTLIADQAPAITSANNATFTVGTVGTLSVTTTGYPASTITESGPLPSGVTFVNNANGTGTLSGKATVSGIYPITFTASNGVGTAATQTFTLTSETTVPASGTTCSGVYTGTFSGNIMVSTGQNCIFVKGGATGNITETGGNLALSNATVSGNVQISGGTYSIGPSTTIKGTLTIQSIPKGSAQNQVCGTTVSGITLQSDGTAATIGAGTPSCPGNTILGSLTLQANSAAVTVSGNSISGSLTDQSNTAATTLSGNTVSGSLTDQSNSGASVLSLNSIAGTLVVQSNSGTSDVSQNTVGGSMTDQGNTALTQVVSNKVTGTLVCQSNTSISGSGDTASKLEGQCATF